MQAFIVMTFFTLSIFPHLIGLFPCHLLTHINYEVFATRVINILINFQISILCVPFMSFCFYCFACDLFFFFFLFGLSAYSLFTFSAFEARSSHSVAGAGLDIAVVLCLALPSAEITAVWPHVLVAYPDKCSINAWKDSCTILFLIFSCNKNLLTFWAVVVCVFDPSTWKAEEGGSLSSKLS